MTTVSGKSKQELMDIIISDTEVSNLLDNEISIKVIQNVLKTFVDVVAHTLGPYGTSNLIQPVNHSIATIFSTKDGFEAINNLRFSEPIPNGIRDSLKDLAYHMQKTIGDGTTSGYPILYSLYSQLVSAYQKELKSISPAGICNILDLVFDYFDKNVFNNKDNGYFVDFTDKTDEEKIEIISKVAAIAANNDYRIAETVSKLFSNKLKSGDETGVDIKLNQEEEDVIEDIAGFELMYGFTDEAFSNQPDKMSLIFEDCAFLVIRGKILNTDKQTVTKIIQGVTDGIIGGETYEQFHKRPLIICADSFSENIIAHVLAMKQGQMYTRKPIDPTRPYDIEPVEFPVALFSMSCLQGNTESEKFYDFATAVGATVVDGVRDKLIFKDMDSYNGFRDSVVAKLGHAKRVEATVYGTRIFGGNGRKEEIEARIKHIEEVINSQHANTTYGISLTPVNDLRSRIAMLSNKMSRIKIGGINAKEKARRRTVYDDVIRSIQSTIREQGYTLGGNVTIPWYIEKNLEKITQDIMQIVNDQRVNICVASPTYTEELKSVITSLLVIICRAFRSSYTYTLLNAYNNDSIHVTEMTNSCYKGDKPVNYNLLTGKYANLEESELIVPKNTDLEIMRAVFTITKDLITSGSILMYNPADTKFKDYLSAFGKA